MHEALRAFWLTRTVSTRGHPNAWSSSEKVRCARIDSSEVVGRSRETSPW